MSNPIISVENVSKRYFVGYGVTETERYTALRDVLARSLRAYARKTVDMLCGREIIEGEKVKEFWALQDVSFEVQSGEVLGMVGRNGAGKSTVLKVLSRITEPTRGRARIAGRVASLLEVGTGFHPELTGRENIYLNGAILGMSRAEIRRKFEEIVAFAEVEEFLDTPVKRFSSGMYVRLAFAVSAHLEPEILLVDEVLAVGDAEFQKKCLGKMSEVARGGRTVLFVSHNIAAVERLCHTGILLDRGRVTARGKIADVLRAYQSSTLPVAALLDLHDITDRSGQGDTKFARVEIWGSSKGDMPATGGDFHILLTLHSRSEKVRPSRISIWIETTLGAPLVLCSTEMTMSESPMIGTDARFLCRIPNLPLTRGRYLLTLFLEQDRIVQDWLQNACSFDVDDADFFGNGKNMPPGQEGISVLVEHSWREVEGVDVESGEAVLRRA
jgi:homopolymeric O-antigen transport system ATP-binding protein